MNSQFILVVLATCFLSFFSFRFCLRNYCSPFFPAWSGCMHGINLSKLRLVTRLRHTLAAVSSLSSDSSRAIHSGSAQVADYGSIRSAINPPRMRSPNTHTSQATTVRNRAAPKEWIGRQEAKVLHLALPTSHTPPLIKGKAPFFSCSPFPFLCLSGVVSQGGLAHLPVGWLPSTKN